MEATKKVCVCPEYDHRRDSLLGPHQHIVVPACDLLVGDRMTISEVISVERSDDESVKIGLLYDGGAEAVDCRFNSECVAVTRPVVGEQ